MVRTYLYGIVEATNQANLGITGIDGASPVYVVTGDGLGCVASDYIAEDLGSLPKEELVRRLLAHQRVVEHVMQQYTVLPVKFGTLLDDPQEVLDLLSQGRSEFIDLLASMADKVEMEVAATWDTNRVLQELGNEDEVMRTREAIASKGQPSVEDRVRLGQVVKGCMDKRREGYQKRMVAFLRPLALDVAPNALLSDDMVMNVAFLLECARQREFEAAVERLDKVFENEINFRVIGPLPAYSFCTVEVTRLTPQQVEEARRMLHLEEVSSEAQVRRAYRRLAAGEQRSLRVGDRLANERFARLKQASDLLLRYCQARKEARRAGHLGLAGQDAELTFVISIKGSRSDEVEPGRFGATLRM